MTNRQITSDNRKRLERQHNIEVLTRQLHITAEQAAKLLDSKLKPVKHDPILIHHEQRYSRLEQRTV